MRYDEVCPNSHHDTAFIHDQITETEFPAGAVSDTFQNPWHAILEKAYSPHEACGEIRNPILNIGSLSVPLRKKLKTLTRSKSLSYSGNVEDVKVEGSDSECDNKSVKSTQSEPPPEPQKSLLEIATEHVPEVVSDLKYQVATMLLGM